MLIPRENFEDAKRISDIFSEISEESKTMAIVYLSALRDKEVAERSAKEDAVCIPQT